MPSTAAHTTASLPTGMTHMSLELPTAPGPCCGLPEAGLFYQGQHCCHPAKGMAHDSDFGQINTVLQKGEG